MELPALGPLLPLVEQLGFGALAGFVAGYALKKVGKFVAFTLGVFFVGVQLLAWMGYLRIEWGQVQADAEPLLSAGSLRELWTSLVTVLTYNLPFAAALVPGLLLGLRRG